MSRRTVQSSAQRSRVRGGPARTAFCILGLVLGMCPPAVAADERAEFLVKLFITACVPNMGNPDGVRAWASANHLNPIEAAAPLQLFVGPGDKGAAWAISTPSGKFVLSIRGTTQACAVWAQSADPTDVETRFKQLLEGAKKPGIRLRVDKDDTEQLPGGRIRGLVYNIIAPGAPTGYEFTMLTADHPAAFQASLQVAKAAAD